MGTPCVVDGVLITLTYISYGTLDATWYGILPVLADVILNLVASLIAHSTAHLRAHHTMVHGIVYSTPQGS